MTTVLIDDSTYEGKAFVELLRKMKFARVVEDKAEWWESISMEERQAVEDGLDDIKNGDTVSHEQMKESYEQWL